MSAHFRSAVLAYEHVPLFLGRWSWSLLDRHLVDVVIVVDRLVDAVPSPVLVLDGGLRLFAVFVHGRAGIRQDAEAAGPSWAKKSTPIRSR